MDIVVGLARPAIMQQLGGGEWDKWKKKYFGAVAELWKQ